MPHHAAFSADGLAAAASPPPASLFSTPPASATAAAAAASSSLAARSVGSDASSAGTASASASTRFGAPGVYPLLGSNTACEAAPAVGPGAGAAAGGSTLPPARSGHSLVTLEDGTLLLFGGGPDENVCNDVYRVSVQETTGAEGQRTLCASYSLLPVDHTKSRTPYERDRHSAWVYQGFMHVFGGEDVHGYMYSDIWMFDHNALTWHERQKAPRGTHPSPRRGQTCTAVGDTVWLFGGLTYERQSVSEVYTLNMRTMAFELVACRGTPPCGRRGHSATHLDGYLYIFGGCDKHEGLLGDLWRLHLTTLVWEKVHSYMPGCGPSPTVGHAAATFRGMLLTFGGNISSEKRASCSEIWMWDPKVGGWLQLRMKEEPRARRYAWDGTQSHPHTLSLSQLSCCCQYP